MPTRPCTASALPRRQRRTAARCAGNSSKSALRSSTGRIVRDPGVEVMVLPDAVDPEIGSKKSFAPESGFFKHADRPGIVGNTGRFDPVQPQRIEGETRHHL